MIQCNRFRNGGFVLHKVQLNGRKYSAWFAPNGTLLAAERFSATGHVTFHVSDRLVNVRHELHRIGQRYVNPERRRSHA